MSESVKFVTVNAAADHLGCTPETVRNHLRRGHYRGYRVPGHLGVLLDLQEVEAALAALPPNVVRVGKQPYGDRAVIVHLVQRDATGES